MRRVILLWCLVAACGGEASAPDAGVETPDATFVCDPIAQDCGADKCTFVDPEADGFAPACLPAGDDAIGDACDRGPGGFGDDTCEAGAFCSYIGELPPGAGGTRRCREICAADPDCAAGERCALLTEEPTAGMCGPTCEPFAGTCTDGMSCADLWGGVAGGSDFFLVCRVTGATALGDACTDDEQCGADAVCFGLLAEPVVCRAICDPAHPCATGSCFPSADEPGVCL